jgi:manganese transport protein
MLAQFVNAASLITSAVSFHNSGHQDVADIGRTFQLLSPLLGLSAIAPLASDVNSTVTAIRSMQ